MDMYNNLALGLGLGLGLGLMLSRRRKTPQTTTVQPSRPLPPTTETNQVVIVTGGANGIGAGCVQAFHQQGATVWFCDIDTAAGQALATRLGNNRAHYRDCDVSNPKNVQHFIHEVMQNTDNQLDVLINNVGVQLDDGTPAHLLDESVWSKVIAINLTSYFLFAKYCLPHLMSTANSTKQTTCIINMSSVQGLQSQPGIPAYASSKGGILSLTRQLSMDYAGKGVRVVAINPGTIRTPLFENLLIKRNGAHQLQRSLQDASQIYPIKRIGEIEEIAEACLFLADPTKASFITGTHLTVDGGIMAKGGWSGAA